MNKHATIFSLAIISVLALGLVRVEPVLAQDVIDQTAFEAFAEEAGFSAAADIRLIVARLIRTALTFAGVILLSLIVYGGFLFMTSGGDATKVAKAKKVLVNAVIGFVIVMSSWAITTFVINSLVEAVGGGTGGAGDGGDGPDGGCPGCPPEYGDSFVVEGYGCSEGDLPNMNVVVTILFSQNVAADSAEANIKIYKDDEEVSGVYSTGYKTVSFTPDTACLDEPSEFCFEADTTYDVVVGAALESTGGDAIDCSLAEPCSSTFTTGNLIDTAEPEVAMVDPSDGDTFEAGVTQALQASALDNGGISQVTFFVDGSEEDNGVELDPSGNPGLYSGTWADPSSGSHSLYARAYDCSGNSSQSTSVSVDEYDPEACTEDADCETGICEDGFCAGYPEIEYVSPTYGTVGNYVTITGEFFGETTGTVTFLGAEEAGDEVVASLATCDGAWTDEQVIIEVPDGFVDGPLELATADDLTDRTDDENGPLISDFQDDGVVRPGLCAVNPESGLPGDYLDAEGINFGDTEDTVYFVGNIYSYESPDYTSWSDTLINFAIPELSAGSYGVQVFVGDQGSNEVSFTVESEDAGTTPVINYLDSGIATCSANSDLVCAAASDCSGTCELGFPNYCSNDPGITGCTTDSECDFGSCEDASDTGPVAQYVTLFGADFGESPGVVYFTDDSGDTVADTDFPDACSDSWWTSESVTVKVPAVDLADYAVWLERASDNVASNQVDFMVTDGTPGPSICAIDPANGPEGTTVNLYGENFTTNEGQVIFYSEVIAEAGDTTWSETEISTLVPSGSSTGPVSVTAGGDDSNSVNFTVADCNDEPDVCEQSEQCCANGTCAATCEPEAVYAEYVWKFATGEIPNAPEVLIQCSENPPVVSPTPYTRWDGGDEACTNSLIQASFVDEADGGAEMNMGTITEDTVVVVECDDSTCETTSDALEGDLDTSVQNTFSWSWPDPADRFTAGSWYQVTVVGGTSGVLTTQGEPLATDFVWQFRVRDDGNDCEIDDVLITPYESTLSFVDDYEVFGAAPLCGDYQCQLCSGTYNWSWDTLYGGIFKTVEEIIDFSDSTANAPDPDNAEAVAISETEPGKIINILAELVDYGVQGEADLTVDFTEPIVENWWPNCDAACVNSAIGAEFTLAMDPTSLAGHVELYECADAACSIGLITVSVQSLSLGPNDDGEDAVLTIVPTSDLATNTDYRVIITGDDEGTDGTVEGVTSESGVGLIGLNYGTSFSWTFTTRDDATPCGIERVELSPERAILDYIGERQVFEATAYGAPDECSASGQRLVATSYDWNWSIDQVTGTQPWDIAEFNPEFLNTNVDLPNGCSATCLNTGSVAGVPVCGNGAVENFEDCDDGNLIDLDGCSSSCLGEGTAAVADGGTCGNGTLEGIEECDDGDNDDGDGCSSVCTYEGSSAAGTVCGDEVVNGNDVDGGEECDDGNTRAGDGCSSVCLNEGSSDSSVVFAVCGNGTVEAGEECEDGNTSSGDGCSATCLNEGSGATDCGNGSLDAWEDCDDGNTENGDGCSSVCLSEGASYLYANPSFCGDGVIEDGEECELDPGDLDANIDPLQIVEITIDAAAVVVDTGENPVETNVNAEEASSNESTFGVIGVDCSCTTDSSCGEPAVLGCGSGQCCFDRPQVTAFTPNYDNETCTNTLITVAFDSRMSSDSLDAILNEGEVDERATSNIVLVYLGPEEDGDYEADDPLFACPDGYTAQETGVIVSYTSDHPWYAKAWRFVANKVAGIFGQTVYAQAEVNCVMDGALQIAHTDTGTEVSFSYAQPLEPNSLYEFVVAADQDITDNNAEAGYNVGVTSSYGVTLEGNGVAKYGYADTLNSVFRTGSDVCELDLVTVEDMSESPGYFTVSGEVHDLKATALTVDGVTTEEIASIPGFYAWEWTWITSVDAAEDDNSIDLVDYPDAYDLTESPNYVEITTEDPAVEGREDVFAEATIIEDVYYNTVGEVESDDVKEIVFLCENPWPAVGHFPFEDTEEGFADFAEAVADGMASGSFGPDARTDLADPFPYSNFSFYYCRDAGDPDTTADDLPALTVVEAPTPVSANIFREILFLAQGDDYSDAIGVRIASNSDYYSPAAWYEDQGFVGSPTSGELDGYAAIADGRTLYVGAANQTGDIYPNIYVIAYSDNADDDTIDIYDQILDNWYFNANSTLVDDVYVDDITDSPYCYTLDGSLLESNETIVSCDYDAECQLVDPDATCGSNKDKLQRDLRRITDIRDIVDELADYGATNKHCSVTKDQTCSSDSNCPGEEICIEGVPALDSGTFIRSRSFSTWPSWQAGLANALGQALPEDPLNNMHECPEGYDTDSCWNGTESIFQCNEGSHFYGYKSIGGEAYELFAELEYTAAPWAYPVDTFTDLGEITLGGAASEGDGFSVSAICEGGMTLGISAECGDGVIGDGEVCESADTTTVACTAYVCENPSETSYNGETCDPAGDITAQCGSGGSCVATDGVKTVACCDAAGNCGGDTSLACADYQTGAQSDSECVPYTCGNGVVEDEIGEVCDDGPLNGVYGYCGEDCTLAGSIFCGDGTLAGGEVCDCGYNESYRSSGAWSSANCDYVNGLYSEDPDRGCAYDCSGPPSYCGDALVNGSEECDSETETWAGEVCSTGSLYGWPCEDDGDCDGGACGGGGGFDACGSSRICESGDDQGKPCSSDSDCDNGTCSANEFELTRTRICDSSCEWPDWVMVDGYRCLGSGACGNGVVEGDEVCDDGNDSSNDECTNSCEYNVCGDGYKYTGVEVCDYGVSNGVPCDASYEGNCNYCTALCQYETVTGGYCGDGQVEGIEFCDGAGTVPSYCIKGSTAPAERALGGTCESDDDCDTGAGYTCEANVGYCNGGTRTDGNENRYDYNGVPCLLGSFSNSLQCGATSVIGESAEPGTCVTQVCEAGCQSACPFSLGDQTVLIQSEEQDSAKSSSLELYSYLSGDTPDTALLYFPACSVARSLTADVSYEEVEDPYVDVVFLVDLSGSMSDNYEGTEDCGSTGCTSRMMIAKAGMEETIEELFDSFEDGKLRIGLVSFESCGDEAIDHDLADSTDVNSLLLAVDDYPDYPSGWTSTASGFDLTNDIFDEQSASATKIIVLISDGSPSHDLACTQDSTLAFQDAMDESQDIQVGGVEVFTAGILSETAYSSIGKMAHLSSEECGTYDASDSDSDDREDCASPNGVPYAYTAQDESGFEDMLDSIVDAIRGVSVTYTTQIGGDTVTSGGTVQEGIGVQLPFPLGFECDENDEFTMPFRVEFNGIGPVELSNIEVQYCEP